MTDDPARLNLLTFLPQARSGNPGSLPQSPQMTAPDLHAEAWRSLWLVLAAHVSGLRKSNVLEEPALIAISRALDAASEHATRESSTLSRLAGELDERVESLLPGSLSGVVTLGLAREEWLATASRLLLRDTSLRVLRSVIDATEQALVLADVHALTVMPAFLGGRPAQPTTLAHYLGGLIAPLQGASERMIEAFPRLNRSPIGSGLLAGDVIAADREDLADRLGFASPVPNTLDALAGVEDVVAMVESAIAGIAPIRRFVSDMLAWIRADPTSFVLDEGWFTLPEPAHPTLVRSERLELLYSHLDAAERDLQSVVERLRLLPYGPLGSANAILFELWNALHAEILPVLAESRSLVGDGLIVNRAYLGNRAGRGYTTAGDLAAFLITEEQLPPASARSISVLVLNQLRQSGLEVSGITQDMIDTAALMIIGREVKVEIESLGRFLAPRRFLERRQVSGSPAPAMTRAWLAEERAALERHRAWINATLGGITSRTNELAGTIAAAAAEASE